MYLRCQRVVRYVIGVILINTMNEMIQLTARVVRDKAIKVCMTERVKQNKVVITQDVGKASEVVNEWTD